LRLPNVQQVLIDQTKITEYLLNPAHPYGASKARFFGEFGFEQAAWETLAQALREHAQRHEVSTVSKTLFGHRYEIIGELNAPDGRAPMIRTIWQVDHGKVAPRLITAYPFIKRSGEASYD
jgi:hypothetical protein